ncbi:MAG: hypothetical protein JO161_04900 [Planctomycetaceae bacterium]|nr:hypothetical protein [Planctomycetaceae bacterium]
MLPEHAGYAIPEFDFWCECELLDDDADEPENWPPCWDAERWELGPGPDDDQADEFELQPLAPAPEPEPYEPSPEDLADYAAWSEDLERQRDLAEAYAIADMLEAIEDERRFTDADLIAAGLPIG